MVRTFTWPLVAVSLCITAACAARAVVPPLPTALAYPDFIYPALPSAAGSSTAAAQIDRGWRYLQNNDLSGAEREYADATRRSPGFYPAHAGAGYVALARRNYEQALLDFDAALRALPTYVPALVGRGQTLLALKRDSDALIMFEAALAADPSLTEVRQRVDVLRFRGLQEVIDAARTAAAAGRVGESRDAYQRAIKASPDSAFLHRELGVLERQQGNLDSALERFRRAVELDATDATSLVQMGELLEQRQAFDDAAEAYRRAAGIEPSADLATRIAGVTERARDAGLPVEFQAIPTAAQITRGDLAALIGVRLEDVVRAAPPREVVVTDVQGHWAARWITAVAQAGIIEPYANHTFQPLQRTTRGDLASAVSRVVTLIAAERADLRALVANRPPMTDMAQGHLSYSAAAVAVASGVLPLLDGGRFEVARPVSGEEAAQAVSRLRALAGPTR